MNTRKKMLGALIVALSVSACSGTQRKGALFSIDAATDEGSALAKWFDGAGGDALHGLDAAGTHATARWVRGEIAFFDGDVERAFDEWAALVTDHPAHPLTRHALARFYTARDEFVDFEHRAAALFDAVDYAALPPVTRSYLSLMHQTIAYRLWSASDVEAPFSADQFGFATKWLTTPVISPWRLSDFDEAFAPQTDAVLAAKYRSPYTAVDAAMNEEEVTPIWTSGISLRPGFSKSGIHYLETIATVEGDAPRDYLLYGNFVAATKVWVGEELVLEHAERDYGSGKLYRKIRLQPGTHRVLVKIGYQTGYRDWFDLTFIPDGAQRTDASGLAFNFRCLPDRELPDCFDGVPANGGVKLLGAQQHPAELEPVYVAEQDAAGATDVQLWLTMIAAFYGGDHDRYAAMWAELQERRPNFAPGYSQFADEVQTQWAVPSKLRDAQALQAIRRAYELDADSLRNVSALAQWLASKGEDREARTMLEAASGAVRDGERLRNFAPLSAWAAYLDSKGWDVAAEQAWREVLAADPSNCRAAQKIQATLHARLEYVEPETITPRAADCPALRHSWELRDDNDTDARVRLARRTVARSPMRVDAIRNLAHELTRAGDDAGALQLLRDAQKMSPSSSTIASELADRAFAAGDAAAALAVLDAYEAREGVSSWLITKRASILGELPLTDLMSDGLAAAKKAVEDGASGALSNDEAYFVIDFAATKYFPDNANITLTHTVIRVMTKGAIDRYGEQNLPGDAVPLLVRTIKQDGTVRVPEQTAGKSVLSMPGLAEGDFVEVAYLQYERPNPIASHIEGVRFFFQMADISTLHSEYVIIGQIGDFVLENGAPQPQPFTYDGLPAVRFLARDNPRPRSEPRTVSGDEFLPWIQMYKLGNGVDDLETLRRGVRESIVDSSKSGAAFERAVAEWTAGELPPVGSEAWVREMFYRVTPLISNPSIAAGAFRTDLNHIVLLKEGNPMLVLKALYDRFGVENDVFLVKSALQIPTVSPVRESHKYGAVLLRVKHDGGESWVLPAGPDAMFGVVPKSLAGQPALCATCDEPERTTVPAGRPTGQDLAVSASLDPSGTLSGRLTFELQGAEASSLRAGLRSRTDATSREKLVDAIASSVFAGASTTGYELIGEHTPDTPLTINVDFVRPNFARETSPGTFQVEVQLFQDAVASAFGNLPMRTTPMFVGFTVTNSYRLDLNLAGWNAEVASQQGDMTFNSPFGQARRTVTLSDNKLTVYANTSIGIQRVTPAQYPEFMRWALAVEQSALTRLRLNRTNQN